jgi:hypothetical protein
MFSYVLTQPEVAAAVAAVTVGLHNANVSVPNFNHGSQSDTKPEDKYNLAHPRPKLRYTGVLISPQPDQEGNKLMFLSKWR